MSCSDNHSFHNCPLRSSSLIIVNSEKQTIVTATDEVFVTLGYEPHQLIDKSVEILGLRPEKKHYLLQHESFGQMIPFNICIHHDPMSNASDLDYWLIRPIASSANSIVATKHNQLSNTMFNTNSALPATILRLSTFGTIDQAYTCKEFPQLSEELKGRPIMSYVHESDVRFLCEKLCKVRHRKSYYTFEVRWLCKQGGRDEKKQEEEEEEFIWVEFTVINSPRRRSCSTAHEPQTRPICIVRPMIRNNGSSTSGVLSGIGYNIIQAFLPSSLLSLLSEQISRVTELTSVLHMALDQGATYLIEFITHLLTYTFDVINEFMYYTRGNNKTSTPSSHPVSSSKKMKKQHHHHHHQQQQHQQHHHQHFYRAVKVSLDDSVWLVPLTQKLENWTRFNRDVSLCKSKKN